MQSPLRSVRSIAVVTPKVASPLPSPVVSYFKYLAMVVTPPIYSNNHTPDKTRELHSQMTVPTALSQFMNNEISPRSE